MLKARSVLLPTAAAAMMLLLLSAALFVSLPVAARAQGETEAIRVDGRTVFRVGAAGETSAAERARQAERRLMRLLENPAAIAPTRIEPVGESRLITVAGIPIVTVTDADAQDNLTTPDALAAQWAQAMDAALGRAAISRRSAWSRFVAEVRASVTAAFARLAESTITIVPRALASLLVLGFFWGLAAGVRVLMRAIMGRFVRDLTVANLMKQVAYYVVWIMGLIVAVDALGFDPQAVATGLGLTGLALGFALKDIISNFVSGVLILLLRPFQIGDQIVVGPTEGDVERILLRATEIRTYDGRTVLVPNAEVFTSRVINNTAAPVRRGSVELYLGYDTDLKRAADVMCGAVQIADGVLADPPASVRVRDLGPDDIKVEARFWSDSRRSDFLATQSAARAALVAALKEAGIGLPDPDVRVIVPRRPVNDREEQLAG